MAKKKKPNIKEVEKVAVESDAKDFACIGCEGTVCSHVSDLPDQQYSGLKDGKEFNTIKREIVRCNCGQTAVRITYE